MRQNDIGVTKVTALYAIIGVVALLGNLLVIGGIVWVIVTVLRWMQVL